MGNCCSSFLSDSSDPSDEASSGNSKAKNNRPAQRWIFSDDIEDAEKIARPNLDKYYTVGRQLGQPGQFGVAYACKSIDNDNEYAVKKIEKGRFIDSQIGCSDQDRATYYQQFRDEIAIMRAMDHPNIVKLVDVFEDADCLFLVMEKCDGGELFDRIKQKKRYSEKDAAAVLREFARGIEAMHKQHIAHCDLKPDNILFLTLAADAPLKIIDFGMSKHSPPGGDRITGFRGTPYYVAPEIVLRQQYTFHCDMWSFGVISFVMLFGFPPFHSRNGDDEAIYAKIKAGFDPTTKQGFGAWFPAKQKISDSAKDLIARCLDSDPVKRLSATEVLEHPWLTGQEASDEPMFEQFIKHLNEFTAGCKLKAAVLDIMTDILTDAEIKQLKKTFEAIDLDGDGQVTAEELRRAVEKQVEEEKKKGDDGDYNSQELIEIKNFEQIIKLADINGDGQLSYKELLATSVQRKMKLKEERMIAAFQKIDSDGDGQITVDELRNMFEEQGQAITNKEAEKIIEEVDTDKNGSIDLSEFVQMWHKQQEDYMTNILGEGAE